MQALRYQNTSAPMTSGSLGCIPVNDAALAQDEGATALRGALNTLIAGARKREATPKDAAVAISSRNAEEIERIRHVSRARELCLKVTLHPTELLTN